MYNPFSLENKIILVTGASSGIGKAVAIECSKMGAKVIITARNTERLNETLTQMEGKGHSSIIADINKEGELNALIDNIPILNGLVNCAGLTKILPFKFINKDVLMDVMNVNFTMPILMTSQLIKNKKIDSNGSIVFISSVNGVYCASMGSSLYSASKGAVNGIIKTMSLELSSQKIRVNSINPGMIETPIFDESIITPEQLKEDEKHYPLKRYGKPEEVAFAVIYLLSDASSWITGSNLVIDGGLLLQ
jgi:NAD(P)-dependent dehydrogenase (short-subunit alcohol dehydrogenase family)